MTVYLNVPDFFNIPLDRTVVVKLFLLTTNLCPLCLTYENDNSHIHKDIYGYGPNWIIILHHYLTKPPPSNNLFHIVLKGPSIRSHSKVCPLVGRLFGFSLNPQVCHSQAGNHCFLFQIDPRKKNPSREYVNTVSRGSTPAQMQMRQRSPSITSRIETSCLLNSD